MLAMLIYIFRKTNYHKIEIIIRNSRCLFNRRTSAGDFCRSNELFTAHLLGGEKILKSTEFLYVNKISVQQRTQLQISLIESYSAEPECICLVASLKIYCTSRRLILRTSCWGISIVYFAYLYLLNTKGQLFS